MVTSASRRRWAAWLASLALVFASGVLIALPASAVEPGPEGGVGEAAYEEATPDPETGLYPGQAAPADDFGPGSPGWITGFTEQEGKAPAAAPVAPKAVTSAPVTKTHVRRTAERAHVHTATVRSTSTSTSAAAGATPPTALPFTGGRLEGQLAAGAALILVGWLMTRMGRPRHVGFRTA